MLKLPFQYAKNNLIEIGLFNYDVLDMNVSKFSTKTAPRFMC